MGLSEEVVITRSRSWREHSRLQGLVQVDSAEARGWTWLTLKAMHLPGKELESLVREFTLQSRGPTIGYLVENSNYAWVLASTTDQHMSPLILNPSSAEEHEVGSWALRRFFEEGVALGLR